MLEYLLENDIKAWSEEFLSALGDNSQGLGLLDGIRALFGGTAEQRA